MRSKPSKDEPAIAVYPEQNREDVLKYRDDDAILESIPNNELGVICLTN